MPLRIQNRDALVVADYLAQTDNAKELARHLMQEVPEKYARGAEV
jgi:hypothetical protein